MNTFIAEISCNAAILNEDESLHCAKVLRKKVGDKIQLIDGKGNFFDGELIFISGKKCEVKIISEQRSQPKRNYYLLLILILFASPIFYWQFATSYDDIYYRIFMQNKTIFEFDKTGNLTIIIDGEVEEYNSEKR